MGDIVLTSPVLRCLKAQVPNVEIHFLTKPQFANLLIHNPYITKVHSLENSLVDTIAMMKKENFDLVIDLHRNLRTARIKLALGVKSIAFRKYNFQKWLLVNFKWNLMPKVHIVDRYMETCKSLGVVYDGGGLDFFLPEKIEENIELPSVPYAVYACGGTYGTKQLPINKVKELVQHSPIKLVLIGDSHDAKRMATADLDEDKLVNLCGKLSVLGSARAIAGAQFVISHDTGMMHIAAALGKKVVSIWGNTTPEFGMTPFYDSSKPKDFGFISEVGNLGCRPCSKLGFEQCPKGHFKCMQLQNTKTILEKLVLTQ